MISKYLKWATCVPEALSKTHPAYCYNLVGGKWIKTKKHLSIVDPLNGEEFIQCADTSASETSPFIQNLLNVPKSGLHNPLKNPQRYNLYGEISGRAANMLSQPEVELFFAKLIQRVAPKHLQQAQSEVKVVQKFLENFSGDSIRFLARGFTVSGDHQGQQSQGYRFPYGSGCIISPFNFPLEIPGLQTLGALYMGNRPTVKSDSKVALVMEQFIRLLIDSGMPKEDLDFINCDGPVMQQLLEKGKPRVTQFTGSSHVAEKLVQVTKGKIRIEDAGFDWKILGPDVKYEDYVAWTCDQDAYAFGGQKCSAQSILFAHSNWIKANILERIKTLAEKRSLEELTIVPILSWNNTKIQKHVDSVLSIPGAKLLFGGKPLKNHTIPSFYGSYYPTAVFLPIDRILEHFQLATTELFGPFQIVTEYNDEELDKVLKLCEKMENHLTAGVVSNDMLFLQKVLGSTVNGVTYCGIRARTSGAPQNHWFGPSNDPRGAGIGSPESIISCWSHHREIIQDFGPLPETWSIPKPT